MSSIARNQPRSPLPHSAVNAAHNLGYQEIQTTKPQTLGQATRISGVTPAAISLLAVHLKRLSQDDGPRKVGAA